MVVTALAVPVVFLCKILIMKRTTSKRIASVLIGIVNCVLLQITEKAILLHVNVIMHSKFPVMCFVCCCLCYT